MNEYCYDVDIVLKGFIRNEQMDFLGSENDILFYFLNSHNFRN